MENTNDLRKAMGCFATGVAIITTSDEQFEPIGVTINSFTSLSISFSIKRSSSLVKNFSLIR